MAPREEVKDVKIETQVAGLPVVQVSKTG